MILARTEELKSALTPGQRLLGLDLGEKTIGLALSDPGHMVASPIETIRRSKFATDVGHLFSIVDQRGCGGLVIGLPLNMDGSEGPRCQSTRAFARNVLGLRDLPILFWDERLSTVAVNRAMIEADMSRAKRAAKIDQSAAAFILQGALDAMGRAR